MPNSLPPEIRRRLGLILARLASDHDGETLNAARLAVKMLRENGWRPEDLATQQPARSQWSTPPPPPPPQEDSDRIRDAAAFAADLMERAAGLTARETAFLQDLIDKEWGRATEKQTSWLRAIAKKAPPKARGAA